MLISEFMKEYSLYESGITGWNWVASNRLVFEVELANCNQEDYTEDMGDFREIILIFDGCTLIDELNKGFDGLSSGDATIYEEIEVKESTSPTVRQGMRLAIRYDNYYGADEKWLWVVIFADEVSVIDPKRPGNSSQPVGWGEFANPNELTI